jgi:hypothetical protein
MKRKTLNLKPKREINWIAIILALGISAVVILSVIYPRQEITVNIDTINNSPEELQGVQNESTGSALDIPQPEVVPASVEAYNSSAIIPIQTRFASVGSPVTDKIPWLVEQAEIRGLNPYLVAAVMALESGWGRSCPRGNCFGYGMTDSGDLGIGDGSFETTTAYILDQFAIHYAVQTAQEMASLGYNFHAEWIVNVNSIQGMF